MKGEQPERLWDVKAVASFLNVSPRQVYNLANATTGGLPHCRVGRLYRFRPEAVRKYADGGTQLDDGVKDDGNLRQ